MNFILDPYILALPQEPADAQRIGDYAENLYRWATEARHREHKFWLSWIIVEALWENRLYPSWDNVQRLIQNAPSTRIVDACTLFRANERSLTEPPLLDDLFDDTDVMYELDQVLVIPSAVEQRLPGDVARALRKTLMLSAVAARYEINDVFRNLLFASAKNGFEDTELQVEFDALIKTLEGIETITNEWPIVTSPAQLDDIEGLASFWEDTDKALRWIYGQIFAAHKSPPPYPTVTTHSGFNDTIKRHQCHNRSATLLKIYRTIVMALTGFVPRNSKTHHPLTRGANQLVSGKATAWRLWIEQKSPGWRLHYWMFTDGSIELANLVPHDNLFIPEPSKPS